jgi:peptide/nickel transport system permease protein
MLPMQPPVGLTAPISLSGGACLGEVVDNACHGTWQHPLGTTDRLQDVLVVTVEGTQSAMYVATVVPVLAAPIGVLVGTLSAYTGGRVDELLMRYVDLQLVLPPFFAYLFLQVFFGRSYLLFVLVFGLLNWGSIARVVRSEALSKTDVGYVRAARDAGSSPLRTVRRHVLPNVSNTVVTSVTSMMPTVILVEVSLGYLQLSDPVDTSWGNLISGSAMGGAGVIVIDGFAFTTWWTEAVPVAAMVVTLVALRVLGDALRDVLDPREVTG